MFPNGLNFQRLKFWSMFFFITMLLIFVVFLYRYISPFSCYPRSSNFASCVSEVALERGRFQDIDQYLHQKGFYIQSVYGNVENDDISIVYRWPSQDAYFGVELIKLNLDTEGQLKNLSLLKRGVSITIPRTSSGN